MSKYSNFGRNLPQDDIHTQLVKHRLPQLVNKLVNPSLVNKLINPQLVKHRSARHQTTRRSLSPVKKSCWHRQYSNSAPPPPLNSDPPRTRDLPVAACWGAVIAAVIAAGAAGTAPGAVIAAAAGTAPGAVCGWAAAGCSVPAGAGAGAADSCTVCTLPAGGGGGLRAASTFGMRWR